MSVYVIASLTSPLTVQRLSQIQAPALILVGDADIADVIAYAGAIEAALPIAFFEVWKDTGHLIQFEHPAELAERLHRFARLADRKEVAVRPAVLNSTSVNTSFSTAASAYRCVTIDSGWSFPILLRSRCLQLLQIAFSSGPPRRNSSSNGMRPEELLNWSSTTQMEIPSNAHGCNRRRN